MMLPVERVQAFVCKAPNESLARGKPPVQNEAMENILDEGPDRNSCQEENHGHPGMFCPQGQNEHYSGVGGIEDG